MDYRRPKSLPFLSWDLVEVEMAALRMDTEGAKFNDIVEAR